MLNLTAPLFAPISCVTDEVVFFHYLLIQLPAHIYFKEAPTGKYTTLHGNGFNVLNVWVSDMITGEMLVAAAGKSCVLTCQKLTSLRPQLSCRQTSSASTTRKSSCSS